MSNNKQFIGQLGEAQAVQHLKQAGLAILERNYRCSLGEMDIIAKDQDALVFIEVRTRSSGKLGWGEESITPQKRARLYRIATHYLKYKNYKQWPLLRFDVIAIRSKDSVGKDSELVWIRGI